MAGIIKRVGVSEELLLETGFVDSSVCIYFHDIDDSGGCKDVFLLF